MNRYNLGGSDQKTDLALRRLSLPFCLFPGLLPIILAGCSESYSPNTYASNAAQVEAAVQRGVIIGVRQVLISADGTIFAAAGGAAGGVAGSQVAGGGVVTALGAIGGTLVGGISGTVAAQKVADTKGWEYIVDEEPGDKLVSVTQTSKTALTIGMHVLVIAGSQQARIVPDYTVQAAATPAAKAAADNAAKANAAPAGAAPNGPPPAGGAANGSATFEVDIGPVPSASVPAPSTAPITVASDPATQPASPPAANPPAQPAAANGATQVAASAASAGAVPPATGNSGGPAPGTASGGASAKPVQPAPSTAPPASQAAATP